MMKKKVYLSGGMADITFAESNKWREHVYNELHYDAEIFNPLWYYNYENPEDYDDEKEIRDFDLYHLRTSDLVIANFNVPKSIGTAHEVALAAEWKIPILGLNEGGKTLHPWLELECSKMFNDIDELISYAKTYYLV